LFGGFDTGDIFHSRGGYWAGLQIVEAIAKTREYELAELLIFPKEKFKKIVKEKLVN